MIDNNILNIISSIKKDSKDISIDIGYDDFIIYGGYISDKLEKKYNYVSDIDIAVRYKNEKQILNIIDNLINNGFNILVDRDYYINHNEYVRLIYAKNDKYFLDIAFMENTNDIGIFTMDSIFFSNKDNTLVDKFNGINDLKSKKISLLKNKNENPIYILSRLLCITSKYNISLMNKEVLNIISRLDFDSAYISDLALSSFLSRIIKSTLLSKNRILYIKQLINLNILGNVFGVINTILSRVLIIDELALNKLSNKKDFIKILYYFAKDDELEDLIKCINLLRYRYWNKDEFKLVYEFGRLLKEEKTC